MSTIGKEYKLAIRIAGVIDKSFTTSLTATKSALRRNVAAINADFTRLDKGFDKIVSTGTSCFTAIATAAGIATVAVGAAAAASISAGTKFESAFAGVKKTVQATAEEYEKLRQDILDMSTRIPSSATEIAGVMEIAGQLGVAKKSLTDFTETMINLGVSTNLSAEDAATALARFANIVQMKDYGKDGVSNFERLGSVVVDLGNNFATTEEEIVSMATNVAAAGKLAGMTEADIMAISTALSAVGVKAEAGGSSISRVIMQMQQAVAGGTEDLQVYAKTAGLTASEFASLFKSDSGGALTLFIEGLGDAGDDGYKILKDLDLNTIRLRKTLLSAAGAGDLFGEAMTMANEAWDKNTALAIEAGKRYETTESKIQIMKNAFNELGVVAYDELRPTFIDTIEDITGGVTGLTEYVGGPNGISEWLNNIGTELPTLQRKFKKFGEPVFNLILGAGKWIYKNGDGIISVLAGIGAALAAYKIASTITHVVNALMSLASLNPVTLGILGVVAAIGVLVAAFAAYKLHERELIDNNLEKHFGDIALSMEDIQAIADYIVSSDSLGGVKEALEAFEDLDEISSTMENAVSELDKMNWKVSIGMELSEEEQEGYKTTIDDYVTAAQEYVEQSQYAVSLNLVTGLGDSAEDSDIITKVNQFYQDSYDEMTSLGQDLSDAVNEAFADNILDPEEMDEIVNLQAKIASLQESLATGKFDAKLSMLSLDYSGANLTADSFQNLQAELATQVEEATQAYKESYAQNYAAVQATYEAGGYLTDEEYQAALDSLQTNYLQNVGDLEFKALQFQISTIKQAYGDDINEFLNNLDTVVPSYADEDDMFGWEQQTALVHSGIIDEAFNKNGDETTKKAIEELLKGMAPSVQALEELKEEYAAAGIELSDEMIQAFSDIDLLKAMTARRGAGGFGFEGDQQAATDLLNQYIVNNEEMQAVEEILRGYGWELPEELKSGMETSAETNIPTAVEGMYAWTQETIDEYYSKGFTTRANTSIMFNPILNGLPTLPTIIPNQRANGGLATRPELTWFAEKGPEMAIPIDGSRNAISLWEQTGRLLGMSSVLDGLSLDSGGSNTTIEYKPTLQFYGEAPSKNDLEDALRVSQDEFDSLMERYIKTHGRVSFG